MKKFQPIGVFFLGVFFLTGIITSCEKEVDFSGQLPPNKLVLNSFIDADSFIVASVSRSWNLSQEKGESLRDAEVSLYINDEFQTKMQPVMISPLPDSSQYIVYQKTIPTHISQIKAKEGDIVKMIVTKSGYPSITAQAEMPGKAKIISVDTIRFNDQYNPNSMRFLIKFKDLDTGKKNYYRLVVEEDFSTDNINWSYSYPVYFYYDQDMALREGFVNATDEMMGTGTENIYGIFNDNSFDGKEYTLNISFHPSFSYVYEDSRGVTEARYYRYRLKLVTLSESGYLYLKSRTYYDYNGDGDPFVEPSVIFSNITNGLGIMGGFQINAVTLDMPVMDFYYY